MATTKILRHQQNGRVWYSYGALVNDKITPLIYDIKRVYGVDLTPFIFKPEMLN